jgi:PAS domain S-box-containing protein
MGETIPFGVWWCNPKGEAEYVSPSFCELLNMTLEEQRKFGWTERLVPEDREPMMRKWLHCCETGTPWDHEHRIIDRYGKIHTVLSRGLPVRNEENQIIAWVGVNLDITARKQVELQLQQAKEQAETANKAKDQLFATISHELRTPLALILGPIQKRLAAGGLSGEEKRDLQVVERNARTLLKHVNDLLDISKLQVGKMEASFAQIDLAWLVRVVSSLFESIAAEREIAFSVETLPELPAQVDPDKIQRVILNLLSNAFKFTPVHGKVLIRLDEAEGRAILTVSDTGPGIPAEKREAVFERFQQLETGSTRRFGGTGLGLAIVREFVLLHQGNVRINDAPGGGACFSVDLPLLAPAGRPVASKPQDLDSEIRRQAVEDLRTHQQPVHLRNDGSSNNAPLVLVVEDNPDMNRFIGEALARHYRVACASNGQEGLTKALELRPDLIISDVMMPQMSGDQMVMELRRHHALDLTPIVLLTAKADDRLRDTLLKEAVQDYLYKPFSAEEVAARAQGLIARKHKIEAERRENEERFRAFMDNSPAIAWAKDEQGRHVYLNRTFEQRFGVRLEDWRGKADPELWPADVARKFRENDLAVLAGSQVVQVVEETRDSEGRVCFWWNFKFPFEDAAGHRYIGGVGIDITERKRAEADREKLLSEVDVQRARLQAILDSLPVGVWITNQAGKMLVINDTAKEIWGGSTPYAEDVTGYGVYKAWWSDTGERIRADDMPLARAIRGETVKGRTIDFERSSGTRGTQFLSAAPVRDRDGNIIGAVAIVQDITVLKETEGELRKLKEHLETRVEERTAELATANRELEAFAYTVSHDLRAPLRHIENFSMLLGESAAGALDEQGRRYLRIINESSERMGRMIENLLTLSRLDRTALNEERVELGQLLEEVRLELAHDTVRRAIEWEVGALPGVRGDATLLRSVLQNLVGNAVKYTRDKSPARIEIASHRLENEWVCSVRDNGAGFDMEFVGKLFGAFQRLHTAREFEGTGIGLASVRRIVHRHGGRTWAEGEVGKGATFYFSLPVSRVLGD